MPFSRRTYLMESNLRKAKTAEVLLRVDGQIVIKMQLRDPGLVALIAKKEGLQIETVEQGDTRYTDMMTPRTVKESAPLPWQLDLLGGTQ